MNLSEIRAALENTTAASMLKEARDPAVWEAVASSQALAGMVETIRRTAGELSGTPIASLPYRCYRTFDLDGSRQEYEVFYFGRRKRLNAFALCCLMDPKGGYEEELSDIIWAVCDEYSWCLPAHMEGRSMEILMEQPLLDKRGIYAGARHSAQERRIDLFGAETGFALAEITTLLYERLDPFLCHRARSLVFERILLPYLDGDTDRRDWEDGKTNWTAVCAGSVGAAALYLIEEPMLLGRIVRRVMDSMENFLEGYGEDGACLEGLSYWNYGFGYFVFFADLLRSRTGGKIDLLNGPQKEKIRRIMTFQQKCFLDGRKAVSFSDAPRENWYAPGLTCYLRRLNPEVAVLPAECMANFGDDGCHRWASDLRNLIWADPVQPDSVDRTESFECLECAQWAILWRDGFSFACKGGHNGEPHNHNDVGSFLLCADKDTFLEDIGVGMHSRQYFGEERYSFLTASSRGHSVPVIDGGYQKEGEEHRASFFTAEYDGEEARIRMEIGGAYGTENIRQIRRSFLADGKNRRLTVTDTFSFESRPKSLTERFMTGIKPEAGPGEVRLKGKKGMACLHYEEKEWELSLSKEVYKPSREEERTVWCVDFTARHPERECEFCLCAEILPL